MHQKKNNFVDIFDRRKNYRRKVILSIVLTFVVLFFALKYILKIRSELNSIDNTIIGTILKDENKSIFNVKELNSEELRNRIILLNVYDIKDFSYVFSVDLANRLNDDFQNKVIIIDVITSDVSLDKDVIINYIIKNNIERPVINIKNLNIQENLKDKSKYFVLINNRGIITNTFVDKDIEITKIEDAINELLLKKPRLNREQLSTISLEKTKNPESFIKSLEHIKYISRIDGTNDGPYFVISDTKGKKLYLLTINGNIVNQIGNGVNGNTDGTGINSTFCSPSGIANYKNKSLYVADGCNSSIRKIDLDDMYVSTLIFNNPILKNPTDVEIIDNNLIISTANIENPLLKLNLETNEISPVQCDNCNNYILKLVKFANKIYFLNNNGLNSIDKNFNVKLEFKLDSNKINPNSKFYIDETGVYIVDKFNNKILRINNNEIQDYTWNKGETIYNLPTDIIGIKDKMYITNENDKKLIQLDKNTKEAKIINITFGYEYNKVKGSEDKFLDINNIQETTLKNGVNGKIYLNLKNGYSLEKMAPQSLALYKANMENGTAILIKNYSKSEILDNKILDLPELSDNSIYYLRGSFYYCNFNKKTPCLINTYNKKIITNSKETNSRIVIDFLYQ